MDLTPEKVEAVLKAVEQAGVKLQVGFNRRFDHNFARLRELVDQEKIGKLELVKITSRDPEPPPAEYAASSGGMFLDMCRPPASWIPPSGRRATWIPPLSP